MAITAQLPLKNRRFIRQKLSTSDRTTIVSIYPVAIEEKKHTLFPGIWRIPAGNYENPQVLTVGPSLWFRDDGEEQPILEIPVSSIEIAESVVRDYCNGILECDMAGKMPGLFFVEGNVTAMDVKLKHKSLLDLAKSKQDAWFLQLTRVADSMWAVSNGNPKSISDDMRIAGKELQQTKEWLRDFTNVVMIKCQACGNLKNPEFPVCAFCKAIDTSNPKAKDLKFAV